MVVVIGFMVVLVGGYVMYIIFELNGFVLDIEIYWFMVFKVIIFGIIWGLIIYNIDCFIVVVSGVGDGIEKIILGEFGGVILRFIMGIIIVIIIFKLVEI